ncbi:unnamed protein product, partial [Pleuronectes platessa]
HSCDVDSAAEGEFRLPLLSPADASPHLHPTDPEPEPGGPGRSRRLQCVLHAALAVCPVCAAHPGGFSVCLVHPGLPGSHQDAVHPGHSH